MYEQEIAQLRALATSNNPDLVTRYRAICGLRDGILTEAVNALAHSILDQSGYYPDPQRTPTENYQHALELVEHHLAQSGVPVIEQQLLALVGVGALVGWRVQLQDDEHDLQVYQSGAEMLDPVVIHRLAKSLDRSPDEEAALWQQIKMAAESSPEDTTLVLAATRCLLDEIPMNELDSAVGTMVIDSILGG
jgi:hypothetical protein